MNHDLEGALRAARYFGTEAEANRSPWGEYVEDVAIYYGLPWSEIPQTDRSLLKQAFDDGKKEEQGQNQT